MVEPHSQQSAAGEFAFMCFAEIFVTNAYTMFALPASATFCGHKPRVVVFRRIKQVTVKMIFHNNMFFSVGRRGVEPRGETSVNAPLFPVLQPPLRFGIAASAWLIFHLHRWTTFPGGGGVSRHSPGSCLRLFVSLHLLMDLSGGLTAFLPSAPKF